MARILILCSRLPYPPTDGARLRMYNTARLLAREHTVDLLVVDQAPVDDEALRTLRSEFADVTVFDFPSYRFTAGAVRGLPSSKPLQVFYYRFGKVADWIRTHARRYDAMYCNHVRTTEYVRALDVPAIADLVDAISRNYESAGTNASGLWRLLYPIESRRLARYERNIVQEFEATLLASPTDRDYVTGGETESLRVVPNGVRSSILSYDADNTPVQRPDDEQWLVFLGQMDYYPNKDAVRFFADEIFPRIRDERPKTRFLVVGSSSSKGVRSLADRTGVTVTGFVDEPADYLSQATVTVAPIRHGAGIQNKVLESMALARSVVSTPLATEGISGEPGIHYRTASNPDSFAAAVLELLADPESRRRLGQNAASLIRAEYTWEAVAPALLETVRSVVD